MTPLLQAENLGLQAPGKSLISAVDLALEAGKLLVVSGPNGAGKTSLVKALAGSGAGIRSGRTGQVMYAGRELANWSAAELARHRAVLPQRDSVAFDFLVRDIVNIGRHPWRSLVLPGINQQAVEEAMAAANASELAERRYLELSGGERQRVQMARVLAQVWRPEMSELAEVPPLLLLDEPTSALDMARQHRLFLQLKRLCSTGAGILAVVHDLQLAAAYADEILLLDAGRVAAHGKPLDVLNAELLEQVYGHPVTVMNSPDGDYPMVVARAMR